MGEVGGGGVVGGEGGGTWGGEGGREEHHLSSRESCSFSINITGRSNTGHFLGKEDMIVGLLTYLSTLILSYTIVLFRAANVLKPQTWFDH